jgi:hypothetical protein
MQIPQKYEQDVREGRAIDTLDAYLECESDRIVYRRSLAAMDAFIRKQPESALEEIMLTTTMYIAWSSALGVTVNDFKNAVAMRLHDFRTLDLKVDAGLYAIEKVEGLEFAGPNQ